MNIVQSNRGNLNHYVIIKINHQKVLMATLIMETEKDIQPVKNSFQQVLVLLLFMGWFSKENEYKFYHFANLRMVSCNSLKATARMKSKPLFQLHLNFLQVLVFKRVYVTVSYLVGLIVEIWLLSITRISVIYII